MRKSLNYKESFLHGKDSLTAKSSTESQIIHWTPELFGPVLKTQRISFSKVNISL